MLRLNLAGSWLLAGLTAWSSGLLGCLILFAAINLRRTIGVIPPPNISVGLILLFVPLGLALIGGYLETTDSGKTMADDFIIFTGTANRSLAEKIASEIGVRLGNSSVEFFPDGELSDRLNETVRGREVFIVQPTS